MNVWFFVWPPVLFKTLWQHPRATSHPMRLFKLVNTVNHTTCLPPSNVRLRDGNRKIRKIVFFPDFVHFHLPLKRFILYQQKQHIVNTSFHKFLLSYRHISETHTQIKPDKASSITERDCYSSNAYT